MISTGNIKNILLAYLHSHPVLGQIPEIRKDVHAPVKEGAVGERIVVVIPGGAGNGQMSRCYPRICVYVPDRQVTAQGKSKYYVPDNERLAELEEVCMASFRSSVYGKTGEEVYTYTLDTVTQEADAETWSNFLNVRLKFEVVNTKL